MADDQKEEVGISIKIHIQTSYEADLEINGRKLKLRGRPFPGGSQWTMEGTQKGDADRTLGGMIARKLHSPLTDIIQAWMPDSMPDRPPEVWEELSRLTAEEIEDKMDV